MYACVLSFQKRSRKCKIQYLEKQRSGELMRSKKKKKKKTAIYSYLNSTALIIQGLVCLWFVISALVSLYSFSLVKRKKETSYTESECI